jgi:hypothetical protein
MTLGIDEATQPVLLREAVGDAGSMLSATCKIGRGADVQGSIRPIGHDVNPASFHARSLALGSFQRQPPQATGQPWPRRRRRWPGHVWMAPACQKKLRRMRDGACGHVSGPRFCEGRLLRCAAMTAGSGRNRKVGSRYQALGIGVPLTRQVCPALSGRLPPSVAPSPGQAFRAAIRARRLGGGRGAAGVGSILGLPPHH